ncbi:hypothetical protein H8K35_12030 [Undibacterium sp. LX40W]|uniref:DUF6701 domain-containing protein n=1 Tax=Undibacterium nitidum TaxID=2762298 RepID=A0A923HQJ6_9BURK|nr:MULTISPECIES: DUF6701 domain-containing protein [Undibacterium]MBC3882113.1 hypothetical protein [Undibacterium nitidum]MBC3892394.1 hypothetical protein [Undibacterium sp. LX40W]
MFFFVHVSAFAQVVEFNSTGGTTATNGLHFYIENTTKIQVRRLNNTGQVYNPNSIPPSTTLDNGVFIRGNGLLYGPSHTVTTFNPTGGMYNTATIDPTIPANPSSSGVQQSARNVVAITNGPQATIIWKYTTPLDFLTAEVTLTIPNTYPVSVANPVRYFHVFDTYLGGSDNGCGVNVAGTKRIVGTYSSLGGATPCPTSTALPTTGTVVESFRERTGTFSSYCAAGWSSFFINGGVNCSVLQTTPLSNTITTTLQDTGIGIAYDFTAPGTYTFSYDFVIGTTSVPAYDHIEIRHDGSATLCPENLVVLACTSSTVPCPPLSIVNTGTLTGGINLVPAAPGASITPATFSIGGSGSTANVTLQATSASAGTYTLVATGLSQAPLNGTRCTNAAGTASSTCDIAITNTPCVTGFECLETGAPYNTPVTAVNRNPLYTKLVNTDFKFDVVAVGVAGAVSTAYAGNVFVELYDDATAPACTSAIALAGTTNSLTFAASDNGRKTLTANLNLANAYGKLRCRVRENVATSPVTACSSDSFTVRPTSIVSVTSNANADGGGISANSSTFFKTGANFSLSADTGIVGYNGTPKINTALLEWLNVPATGLAAPGTGTLAGLFTTAANAVNGNGASGATFTYDEVGYFRFKAQGVFDDSFTANSNDASNNDCTNDASNVLVGGKYGCKFGNTSVTNHFGRFVPDHLTVSPYSFIEPCTGFTYMDQPFSLTATIEGRNAANNRTFNYSGIFGRGVVSSELENANNGVALDSTRLTTTTPSWTSGRYLYSASNFSRLAVADGPYDAMAIGVNVTDPDGIKLVDRDMQANTTTCTADSAGTSNGTCTAKKIADTRMRQGRVKLLNAYGSEKLALPLPLKIEYWAGVNAGWTTNALDTSCTFPVATNYASSFSFTFPAGTTAKPNNLAACETAVSVSPLKLSAPGVGNSGFADITLNLGAASGTQCTSVGGVGGAAGSLSKPWLQFNWTGTGNTNPKARVNFGIYKKGNEFIYLREVH